MNNSKKLTVFHTKKIKYRSIIFPACSIATMLFAFSHIPIRPFYDSIFLGTIVAFLIKTFLAIGIGLLTYTSLRQACLFLSKTPLAILDQNGILVKHYGFFPWNNIIEMKAYTKPTEQITLSFDNISTFYNQIDYHGRFDLFVDKVFGYKQQLICITNLDISAHEIMAFSQPFLIPQKEVLTLEKPTKLIANYNRSGKKQAPFIILCLIGMLAAVYLNIDLTITANNFLAGSLIGLLVKNLIILLRSPRPLAILDEKGIWINHFGFIDWTAIKFMVLLSQPPFGKTPIGIRVKNIKRLQQQTDWIGSLRLFYARTVGSYHISIQNTAISEYDIIEFAQHYLKQEGRP